jgi:hypothetical protein
LGYENEGRDVDGKSDVELRGSERGGDEKRYGILDNHFGALIKIFNGNGE